MNVTKKIISFITVVFIVIRIFAFSVSASFAVGGAIAAEELTEIIGTLLFSSGAYTQEQINGMSLYEMESNLKNGLNNGTINPARVSESIPFYDDSSGKWIESIPIYGGNSSWSESIPKLENMSLWDVFCYLNNIPNKYPTANSLFDKTTNKWLGDLAKDGSLLDKLHMTTTVDLKGSGALFEWYNPDGYLMKRAYCEYIIRDPSGSFSCYGDIHEINYYPNGTIQDEYKYPYGGTGKYISWTSFPEYQKFYGDVRYEDGTQVETDDEAIPVIGEADGTQVTPDMLNPDGTVTIDGTTYYPKDFIDWDKFKDPAIIDLLNQILSKIDDIDVIEPDTTKDLVDSITDSVDISVSEELSDYMMPTGISSVFPFCLPFDLYRGIRLLSVKPVAPVLEIPFEVPEFGLFKGYKTTLTIEFEKYDKYFSVFRWGTYLIFALGLIFISTKIVKGAGA